MSRKPEYWVTRDGPEICDLCQIPKATGACPHIIQSNGQVTMSGTEWGRLVAELAELRTREAAAEDRRIG